MPHLEPKDLLRAGALLVIGVAAAWLGLRDLNPSRLGRTPPSPPQLFEVAPKCLRNANALEQAERAETQGHLYAERYPYDPQDGVRGTLRFEQARACYRLAGFGQMAHRADESAALLKHRVEMDYASSQLLLASALNSEKWSTVVSEAHRQLRLTAHLQSPGYVGWLEEIMGRASARAGERD